MPPTVRVRAAELPLDHILEARASAHDLSPALRGYRGDVLIRFGRLDGAWVWERQDARRAFPYVYRRVPAGLCPRLDVAASPPPACAPGFDEPGSRTAGVPGSPGDLLGPTPSPPTLTPPPSPPTLTPPPSPTPPAGQPGLGGSGWSLPSSLFASREAPVCQGEEAGPPTAIRVSVSAALEATRCGEVWLHQCGAVYLEDCAVVYAGGRRVRLVPEE